MNLSRRLEINLRDPYVLHCPRESDKGLRKAFMSGGQKGGDHQSRLRFWSWSASQPKPHLVKGFRGNGSIILDRTTSIDRSQRLSLKNIREQLIRLEDTIVFALIERAQFARNQAVYEPGTAFEGLPNKYSALEYLLRETEAIHGRIRRYTSPDEHAFFPEDVPEPILPPLEYAPVLAPFNKEINLNTKILNSYTEDLLSRFTAEGDDGNYGSSAMHDVLILQALSKRIHYGKFVAEAKFLDDRRGYTMLIENKDSDAIMELLTNKNVEEQVLARVRQKASNFGLEYTPEGPNNDSSFKIDPLEVSNLFENWIMPLTKEVEVIYLLRRLEWDH